MSEATPNKRLEMDGIFLPEEFSSYSVSGQEAQELRPFSNLNIFVGANNTGKSRFMRLLSQQVAYSYGIDCSNIPVIKNSIEERLVSLAKNFEEQGVDTIENVSIDDIRLLTAMLTQYLKTNSDVYEVLRKSTKLFEDFTKNPMRWTGDNAFRPHQLSPKIREAGLFIKDLLTKVPINNKSDNPKRIYIPILRGLRPLDDNRTDFYLERTQKDYFPDPQKAPEIFTGLGMYDHLQHLLLGDHASRTLVSDYEQFLSKEIYEGQDVTLIPNLREKDVVVKIGNERERSIYNLGDGVQAAILLTFLPFTRQEPTFFFIEEPELFMHPGLQRKVLTLFNSLERHTFFMTTHSNHLLDITIDIKEVTIFVFRKVLTEAAQDNIEASFEIEAVDGNDRSSLELLGVRNSSVFLVNATIWVEGITDRWYLRAMLNSYMESEAPLVKLEEDVHYCFVEYGGSNITHWSFLDCEEQPIEVERLCARAMVIVDEDGNAKLQRKQALQNKLGDRFIIVPGREIENTLPYCVIRQVLAEFEGIAVDQVPALDYEQYNKKPLGQFLNEDVFNNASARKGGYAAESGTLKDKVGFCERATKHIKFDELPTETQTMVRRVYNFVREQNA